MKIDKEETNIGSHAILLTPDGKLILQERDNKPKLINPGLISMFGGTTKADESLIDGLKRELEEELGIKVSDKNTIFLGKYLKTKTLDGINWEINVYIVQNIRPEDISLMEGKSLIITDTEAALKNKKLTRITRLAIEDFIKIQI